MIKTFRGLMVDGAQDTIVLHTNDGSIGYRIVKFQAMATAPGSNESTNVLKIYKVSQSSVNGDIDFSDNTLLGAIDFRQHDNEGYGVTGNTVIFDQEIFNQDIYVTHKDNNTGVAINYYLELEKVKLDLSESTVATLKDIRNVKTQGF
jgi:hypothetical protein